MLQQPATPAVAPVAPAPPAPPAPAVEFPAGSPAAEVFAARATTGVPTTARELRALRSRRSELSTQLNSATDRRKTLVRELQSAPDGQVRAGLEERLKVLDERIVQLERDLSTTGQQLVATPAEVLTSSSEPQRSGVRVNNRDIDVTPIAIIFMLAVLMPMAMAMARRIWKRSGVPVVHAPSAEDRERMMRLEQAVDTIAVEVERISEGQRFVTQLLADGRDARQLAPAHTLDAVPDRR
jgi:cell division septum initiation protein DivIVA